MIFSSKVVKKLEILNGELVNDGKKTRKGELFTNTGWRQYANTNTERGQIRVDDNLQQVPSQVYTRLLCQLVWAACSKIYSFSVISFKICNPKFRNYVSSPDFQFLVCSFISKRMKCTIAATVFNLDGEILWCLKHERQFGIWHIWLTIM